MFKFLKKKQIEEHFKYLCEEIEPIKEFREKIFWDMINKGIVPNPTKLTGKSHFD